MLQWYVHSLVIFRSRKCKIRWVSSSWTLGSSGTGRWRHPHAWRTSSRRTESGEAVAEHGFNSENFDTLFNEILMILTGWFAHDFCLFLMCFDLGVAKTKICVQMRLKSACWFEKDTAFCSCNVSSFFGECYIKNVRMGRIRPFGTELKETITCQ